jgi:transposase
MARSLKIRKPRASELRKLESLFMDELSKKQQRRAEVILLYGEGLTGVDIAAALEVHPVTIYQDLRTFAQQGLACLQTTAGRGAPKKITPEQKKEILRLAELSPIDVGLPLSHWSLRCLREYLIKTKLLKQISREALRLVLKKGGCDLQKSAANSRAQTRKG